MQANTFRLHHIQLDTEAFIFTELQMKKIQFPLSRNKTKKYKEPMINIKAADTKSFSLLLINLTIGENSCLLKGKTSLTISNITTPDTSRNKYFPIATPTKPLMVLYALLVIIIKTNQF
ncbi:MAG: hypothetical protein D9N14_14670 [Ketobacter sp.]|nr:MAG: hypothetical protein D9N14_14670 [Ketobacter sp.]